MKDRRATAIALAFAVLLVGSLALSRMLQPPTSKRTSGSPPDNPAGCLMLRVLASSEKLNAASPYVIASLSEVSGLIVERTVPEAVTAAYERMGLSVTRA